MKYYITDRKQGWHIRQAIQAGFNYIQIREKDLPARELLRLTREAVELTAHSSTKILVNERADVALAAGAHGVHLPSHSIAPRIIKSKWPLIVGVSCHSLEEVQRAEREEADFAVFGPVFSTPGKGAPAGLEKLKEVCRSVSMPVFALGGIDLANAQDCFSAGAAGVAGIRLITHYFAAEGTK